jgi:hypothetical protein
MSISIVLFVVGAWLSFVSLGFAMAESAGAAIAAIFMIFASALLLIESATRVLKLQLACQTGNITQIEDAIEAVRTIIVWGVILGIISSIAAGFGFIQGIPGIIIGVIVLIVNIFGFYFAYQDYYSTSCP